jgi:hypothetical protein
VAHEGLFCLTLRIALVRVKVTHANLLSVRDSALWRAGNRKREHL